MHQDTAESVADLESRLDIKVKVDEVRSRGFDGAETLMYVITAFAGGVTSGLLAKIGEDLWTGVRKIAGSLRQRARGKATRTVAVVVQDSADGPIRFRCDLDDDLTADALAEAFRVVETDDGTEVRILPVEDSDDA